MADDKDEVAAKRGQPKQDKGKAKEHYANEADKLTDEEKGKGK